MFEIEDFQKAKLIDIEVLSQKNRLPDENPGAKLTLEQDMPSGSITLFDGALRGMLFELKAKSQGEIDGMETEVLTAIGRHIGTFRWKLELTGYTLTVDRGMGWKSNLVVSDCVLSGWRLTPKDGGFKLKYHVESADISEAMFGKLAKLKSCEIAVTLAGPEVAEEPQQSIDDKPKGRRSRKDWPFPKDGAKTDAELAQH